MFTTADFTIRPTASNLSRLRRLDIQIYTKYCVCFFIKTLCCISHRLLSTSQINIFNGRMSAFYLDLFMTES